jgi:anaerobic magnesium-protoporphyrin IX monomethyl ester cyclase
MIDILLIQPPIEDFYLTKKRTIPYGLISLAASLIKNDFSTEIFDGLATPKSRIIDLPENMQYLREFYPMPDQSSFGLFYHFRHFGYSYQHIGQIAGRSGAFLVGISSLFTAYSEQALVTASIVKKYHPNCKIVIGGHHPTQLPRNVIGHPAVDYILRGEAEESLPLLAKAIQNGHSPNGIPGIVYQKPNQELFISDPAVVRKLDDIPTPSMELIKHQFYQRSGKNSMVIATSRGCPMKCSYCSVSATSAIPFRQRSVSRVLDEIEQGVEKHNVGFIDFEDENLSLNRQWFQELLKEIQSRYRAKAVELRAMNGLLPTTLDEKLIESMKLAGFKTLNLSLCSTSKTQLKRFQRPDASKAFDKALGIAEKLGLDAVGYIIVGGPDQAPEESVADLLFLASRKVLAGVSVFYPAPGSKEYDNCQRLGLLPTAFSLMRSTALPLSQSTTRLDAVTLLRLGRVLNFMKNLKAPHEGGSKSLSDKYKSGEKLLEHFIKSGNILGVDPDGQNFEHPISRKLTRQFIKGLKDIRVRSNI